MTDFWMEYIFSYRAFYVYGILMSETALHIPCKQRSLFPLRIVIGEALFLAFGLFFPDPIENALTGSTLIFIASVFLFEFLFQNTPRVELYLCVSAYLVQTTFMNIGRILQILLHLPDPQAVPINLLSPAVGAVIAYFVLVRVGRLDRMVESGLQDEHAILMTAIACLCTIIALNTLIGTNGLDDNPFARITILGASCFVLPLQFLELRSTELKAENRIIQQLLAAEQNQYLMSKESIDIINMKCHDLKHQIAAVRAANQTVQKSALEKIENAVTFYDAVARTGNETLDAVLTEKILYCEKHNISLSYMVDQASLSFLDATDIYSLFGNALDNAIESVMKADKEKRVIIFQVAPRAGCLSIHLENYCSDPPQFVDGLPQTTKADTQNHGFGVRSIRYLVQQYGGHTVFHVSGSMFVLDIIIPIPA